MNWSAEFTEQNLGEKRFAQRYKSVLEMITNGPIGSNPLAFRLPRDILMVISTNVRNLGMFAPSCQVFSTVKSVVEGTVKTFLKLTYTLS